MKKLVLIDGNSLINRAFYATPVFTTRNGIPTNAIFGFTKFLFKIIDKVKPDYLIVAFDMKAPTFRHKMYEGYKSTRKGMPDELAVQLEPLQNLLKTMKIAIYQQEGIEADDILGTLSKKFDVHSYVYSGDRDCFQLVDDKTDVCFTKRGVSDLLQLNVNNFKEETGLPTPSHVVDLKALMGDKSDNIPGVPGVGEKTALNLIEKFGNLNGVYANLDKMTVATRAKLNENRDSAFLSYRLATINRDCDISINLDDCVTPVKYDLKVKKLFSDFEFRSLLLLDIFEDTDNTEYQAKKYPEKIICKSSEDISRVISEENNFAVVLSEDSAEIYSNGKQYSLKVTQNLFVDEGLEYEKFIDILKQIYTNKKNTVIAYNFKEHKRTLNKLQIETACNFEDLAIIKYLCDYNSADSGFKFLCDSFIYDYNYSAFALNELYEKFLNKLNNEYMAELYNEIEKPLVNILYEMESYGVKISTEGLNELSKQYLSLTEEYKKKIFDICGTEFNLNSPMKLGEILHDKLGISEVKKKKTGNYATNAEVLEKLVDKSPVIDYILKFRLYQKLNSTYVEGFKPLIDKKNNLIHTTYHQTVTSTGRLSSSNPNLQNIPVRKNEGRELRKIFIAREGNVFIDADYSQIELRLLAHLSECKELINAFESGMDFHTATASKIFGVSLNEVTPEMRGSAKAVNFGIIYGMSDFGLARDLNVPISTAKEFIDKYFETYGAVKTFMEKNIEFARKNGYVSTLTGRKRSIPELKSANYNLRQFGERAAMNMPLQGSSADIIKIAMIKVAKALKKENLSAKLILQVHDELVLEAPENEAEAASAILKENMENAYKLKVPLTVEVHSGKTWYDAK